jgi:hypothetical protein
VLTEDEQLASRFFASLKEEMKQDWEQEDVLIVQREVRVL